jgi:integrase
VRVTLAARVASGRLKVSTADSYADIVTRHITPGLGRHQLDKLTPAHVREWLTAKQSETSARKRPLSSRTVAYCHAVLRKALADAVRDELVGRNVALLVEPPVVRRDAVEPLTPAEATALVAAAARDRLGTLWLVMLGLGLRRGEALALRWNDVDLDAGVLRIRSSLQRLRGDADPSTGRRRGRLVEVDPKTAASAAPVAIPTPVVDALRAHRRTQAAERMAARAWVDPGLVFTTSVGTPLEPRNVNRAWAALCDRAGVRRLRVHDLRHATATFMLAAGVDLKVIQATLRHSRLSTTADVYAHVLVDVQRAAADRMGDVLGKLGAGAAVTAAVTPLRPTSDGAPATS